MKQRVLSAFSILALAALPAFSLNMVVNPSFEDPDYINGTATFGVNALLNASGGWLVYTANVPFVAPNPGVGLMAGTYLEGAAFGGPGATGALNFTSADGTQHVDLTGQGNQGATSLYQDVPTVAGQWYTLRFSLGNIGFGHTADLCVDAGCNSVANDYSDSARMALVIDGNLTIFEHSDNGNGREVVWRDFSYTFQADTNLTRLEFANGHPFGNDNYVGLDDVSMDAVPEPATVAMMGCGLFALGLLRNRFRKN